MGSFRLHGQAALICLLVAVPAGRYAVSDEIEKAQPRAATVLGSLLMDAATVLSEGNFEAAGLNAAGRSVDYLIDGIGEDAPDWAKRIEFDWSVRQDNAPEWSVLTVQPLWESDNVQDTVFTQWSYRRYQMFGIDRDVVNAGLGYRRLLLGDTVLVGVNGFFDFEFDHRHRRASLGAEVKWSGLDFTANRYWAVSDPRAKGTATEEVLDGHDIELSAQLPYLPWARVRARRYWWDTVNAARDIDGWVASAEVDLMQNLQLEGGVASDNYIPGDGREAFLTVRFRLDLGRPVALSTNPIADTPWQMRDMKTYRLDKVRRENKIIVERRGSGVVITRGS